MSGMYPSVYEAKAVSLSGNALTVFVPAVFGEQSIQVTDFISPPAPGMGWVAFQGGNCEFPVWIGSDLAVNGSFVETDEVWVGADTPPTDAELWYDGHGLKVMLGGTWVDIAGSEVYIGADPPTDPTTELWYDTDAVPTVTPTPWIPATLQNNWAAVGGSWEPPRYRKVGDMTQLGGNISGGTANQAAFILPVGFRPAYNLEITCSGYNSSTGRITNMITVDTTGGVRPEQGGSAISASLCAIEFSVTP